MRASGEMVLEGTARAIARETQVHNRRIKRLALVDPGLGVLGMVTGSGPEPMYNLYEGVTRETRRAGAAAPLPFRRTPRREFSVFPLKSTA